MKRKLKLHVRHNGTSYAPGDDADPEHVESLEAQGLLHPAKAKDEEEAEAPAVEGDEAAPAPTKKRRG